MLNFSNGLFNQKKIITFANVNLTKGGTYDKGRGRRYPFIHARKGCERGIVVVDEERQQVFKAHIEVFYVVLQVGTHSHYVFSRLWNGGFQHSSERNVPPIQGERGLLSVHLLYGVRAADSHYLGFPFLFPMLEIPHTVLLLFWSERHPHLFR
ncbi:hypothetical protein [Hallella sp.]|uniref:hypothetical protein n=1 Tax=Hallella sp. TaxID=2980186 RepID=UPI003078B7E1